MDSLNLLIAHSIATGIRGLYLAPIRWGDRSAVDAKVRKIVDEQAKKMGISKPVELAASRIWPWAAHGTNFSLTKAGITVPLETGRPRGLFQSVFGLDVLNGGMAEDEMRFVVSHELAHIKNNDLFTYWIIPVITCLATTILFGAVLPMAAAELMISTAFWVSAYITSFSNESSADMEACKYLSNKEKRGGIKFLKSVQEKQKALRNEKGIFLIKSLYRKAIFTESGEVRFGFTHPSLASRIKAIEATIQPISFFPRILGRA